MYKHIIQGTKFEVLHWFFFSRLPFHSLPLKMEEAVFNHAYPVLLWHVFLQGKYPRDNSKLVLSWERVAQMILTDCLNTKISQGIVWLHHYKTSSISIFQIYAIFSVYTLR